MHLPNLRAAICTTPVRTKINGNPSKNDRFFFLKVFLEAHLLPKKSVRGRRGPAATAIAPSFSPHTVQHFNFYFHYSTNTTIFIIHY